MASRVRRGGWKVKGSGAAGSPSLRRRAGPRRRAGVLRTAGCGCPRRARTRGSAPALRSPQLPQPLWHRCSHGPEPLHLGACELHQVRPPHVRRPSRAADTAGGARSVALPGSCHRHFSVQLAVRLQGGTLQAGSGKLLLPRGAGSQGREEGWSLAGPTCSPEVRPAGRGLGDPCPPLSPGSVPGAGGGVWSTRKSRFFSLPASLPCESQGNTLGRLSGGPGRWDLKCGVNPGPRFPVPRLGLCRPAGARRPQGDARGARRGRGYPATPPARVESSGLLPLQEPSVVPWRRPPCHLPQGSPMQHRASWAGGCPRP